jgi:hypothetical protein
MSTEWWSAGQRWLERQASKEAESQKRAWVKGGRSAKTFRYNPPDWHRDAVAALGRNDEETFKAIKLDQLGTQGLPPLPSSKAGRRRAAKKSPAQLQRDINESLAKPLTGVQGRRNPAELSMIALTTEVRNMRTAQRLRPNEDRQRYIDELENELRTREARFA